MAISITFLGHSGFLISNKKHTIAIDPFLTDNPVATMKASDVTCQYIGLTHGHYDHIGDSLEIAKTNDACIIATFEITSFMESKGLTKLEPANTGGRIETDFGWVAFTQAFHSSSYEGTYMGMPNGLMIHIDGTTIYHCGDTDIFGDMALLRDIYKPEIAFVPIGGRFTMDPALAMRAVDLIKPKYAIPIHYNTWPPIEQNPKDFCPQGVQTHVMSPGDVWDVSL
jgi:L-ascorbate metabolism protein UlaG (beta-lactamase superfamily)